MYCSIVDIINHFSGPSNEAPTAAWIVIPSVAILISLVIIVFCVLSFIVYKRKKNQRDTSKRDQPPFPTSDLNIPRPSSEVTEPANDGEPEYISITTVTLPQTTRDPNTSNDICNIPQVSGDSMNVPMTHNKAYGIFAGAISNQQDRLETAVPSTYEDDYYNYEHYY